ncbi:MAG: Uma2 family endonuclease [Lewinellaceae bacterium]|nr:Uma2 family endonuclease [Saprospiraceae bacterium]MCB9341306.1 Uma2 family endonuclease [Lewinellaceae bacterium]
MVKDEVLSDSPAIESDYETERNKPMPNRIHGTIQTRLVVLLDQYSDRYQFSSEVTLDTTPPSTPDILFFHKKQLNWKTVEAKEKEMPITTIGILSPRQTIEDLAEKAWNTYFPAGVQSAWIVVPPLKTVSILTPDDKQLVFSQGTLTDPVTGIQLSVEKIFDCLA